MNNTFVTALPVRIFHTDAQGVVHYAGYYNFFTSAIEEYGITKFGKPMALFSENLWFVIVESCAKYYKPAKLGDILKVYLIPEVISDKAIKFNFEIKKDGILLVDGYLTLVAIDKTAWKAVSVPKEILEKFT